jgi:hypothetical protein
MTTVPKDDFRPLFHLVSLGVVGAATVGVFFGVGFLWLAPPRPAAPPADPALPAQSLEAREVPTSGGNDTPSGSSAGALASLVTVNATSDEPSNAKPAAIEATLIP